VVIEEVQLLDLEAIGVLVIEAQVRTQVLALAETEENVEDNYDHTYSKTPTFMWVFFFA